jgi:hypothetical protein
MWGNAMAKRPRKINKSQAIRDYLAKSPTATPSQIKQDLAKKGIAVGDSLISQIKYRPPKAKGKRRAGRTTARRGSKISLEMLLAAKGLAERLGGTARAHEALSALEKLLQ